MASAKRPARAAPAAEGDLAAYNAKRDFAASPEPAGSDRGGDGRRFVVQRHDATRLHFDFRLELDGVLKSWAVTRGPSLVPADKRLAVRTEDHPQDYLGFEGVIPAGQYGGGTVIVWDTGVWEPEGDPQAGLADGHLAFRLAGQRLTGLWSLIRMRPKPRETREQWLLVKGADAAARGPSEPAPAETELASVLSGRTNADLAAAGTIRSDHAARAAASEGKPAPKPQKGARKGLLPVFVEPQLATLAATAPSGPAWIHEIKLDGYRLQARIDGPKVALLTRKGLDWTARFPGIAEALLALKLGSALLDGEVVVETASGLSSFGALQEALSDGRVEDMVFHVFDLLYLDGRSLQPLPLAARKAALAEVLAEPSTGGALRISEHLDGDGPLVARHACRLGLEGIVSKRADRPYRSGRGDDWLKTKCTQRQEFVIAGFVPSTAAPAAVGSLILGVNEPDGLVHAGRAGTGFSARTAAALRTALAAIERPEPPFAAKLSPEAGRGARWVDPQLVAEIEFRGWTRDGLLRHAAFKGLREDKAASEVVRERAAGEAEPSAPPRAETSVRLTHPDRVLWREVGLTKQGLADYYGEIAPWMLPHVAGRPLSLVRAPEGIDGHRFFQKHGWAGMDAAIRRRTVDGEELLWIEDADGLLALVQAGVLEIHVWGATMQAPQTPDRLVFDLDPDEGLSWDAVVTGAREVRRRLADRKLDSVCKTSGGKGLHVVVPIAPTIGWDEAKAFTKRVVAAMEADSPSLYTASLSKAARKGRIFIDYLRNASGATAVAPYSTRARLGAPVSTPIAWEELASLPAADHHKVATLPARLAALGRDPWSDIAAMRQALPPARRR